MDAGGGLSKVWGGIEEVGAVSAATTERVNWYRCEKCAGVLVTVDVSDGTTPFLVRCRATEGCDGMARSGFYQPKPEGAGEATWEWHRPVGIDYAKLSKANKAHVDAGGLLMRRRKA